MLQSDFLHLMHWNLIVLFAVTFYFVDITDALSNDFRPLTRFLYQQRTHVRTRHIELTKLCC